MYKQLTKSDRKPVLKKLLHQTAIFLLNEEVSFMYYCIVQMVFDMPFSVFLFFRFLFFALFCFVLFFS